MRNSIALIFALMVLCVALPGCGTREGQKLVTYSSNTTELPAPVTVNKAGTYALYPDDGLSPLEKIQLNGGEKIGFRRATDGRVVAFAGDKEFPLNAVLAQEYVWKYQGQK
jgi:hypothetical protein